MTPFSAPNEYGAATLRQQKENQKKEEVEKGSGAGNKKENKSRAEESAPPATLRTSLPMLYLRIRTTGA
jgi:hypothetical protein